MMNKKPKRNLPLISVLIASLIIVIVLLAIIARIRSLIPFGVRVLILIIVVVIVERVMSNKK